MIEKSFLDKVRNYLTLGTANFAATSINAIFWIYMASLMDKSEYGFLGYLMSFATTGFVVSNLGLVKTIVVYGAKGENILSPAYTVGLISTSAVSIVIYIITQNISVSFLTWGMMIFALKLAELNSKKLYSSYAKHRILRSSLIVILALVLFQIFGINGIVLGFALSTLPAFIGLFTYAKSKKINPKVLKPKVKFMMNSWLNRLSTHLFLWSDKIIVGSLFGFSLLGSFQLASQYLSLLNTIPIALSIYLIPQEAEGKSNKKIKILAIGVSCIIVLISFIILPPVIDTLLPKYHESIVPAQIMSIAIIPLTISVIFDSQFFGKEMPKMPLIGLGLQVIVYFSLLISLGMEFGIIGIAIGFLIAAVGRVICLAIITRVYLK